MAYQIEEETVTSIHDAICQKRWLPKSTKIMGSNFDNEILEIDAMQKMYRFPDPIENGGRGMMAANCAGTYIHARATGLDEFVYRSNGVLFSGRIDKTDYPEHASTALDRRIVRNSAGKALIDCSTFVSLVLRDIPYSESPYAKHKGANATWCPSTELSSMYGAYSGRTIFNILDKQPAGYHNNIDIYGRSTIRTAGDLAEFFYRAGCVIYDRDIDGQKTASWLKGEIAPGDLLFWSGENASENQSARFRHISHVAMASQQAASYLEATGGTLVCKYTNLTDEKMETLVFVIRPDWRATDRYANIPKNQNCLSYPWSYQDGNSTISKTESGIKLSHPTIDTIKCVGTSTAAKVLGIRGDSSETGDYLYLTAGDYELSGMAGSGINSTNFALRVVTLSGSEIAGNYNGAATTNVRAYDGHEPVRFTLTVNTKVCVYLRWANGVTLNTTIRPTLIRV